MSHFSFDPPIPAISVQMLAERLNTVGETLQLVDVREPQEVALANIPGFENFPLSEFADWSGQIHTRLDATVETLVICHHGFRSAQMCQWLMAQGFSNVKNVTGGIDAYATAVDSTIPHY